MKLNLTVRQLPDGAFRISWKWRFWEMWNRQVYQTQEEMIKAVEKLVSHDKWTPFGHWD